MKSSNENNPSFCLEVWGTDYNKIKNTSILAEKLVIGLVVIALVIGIKLDEFLTAKYAVSSIVVLLPKSNVTVSGKEIQEVFHIVYRLITGIYDLKQLSCLGNFNNISKLTIPLGDDTVSA